MAPVPILLHIRQYREASGLTLRELAAAVGKSKSYLQRAEVGKGDFSVYVQERLATQLQVDPRLLVEFAAWPMPTPCTCPCHAEREEPTPTP